MRVNPIATVLAALLVGTAYADDDASKANVELPTFTVSPVLKNPHGASVLTKLWSIANPFFPLI
jgi:hypothetical protein